MTATASQNPKRPWNEWVLDYYEKLTKQWPQSGDIEVLSPFLEPEVADLRRQFYDKYYDDTAPRQLWLGINPGRHGAGITGIPFSDPVQLAKYCQLSTSFAQREELSAAFVFQVIEAAGGPDHFFRRVFIDSVSPFGYVRDGLNFNYYDDSDFFTFLRPHLQEHLDRLLARPGPNEIVLLGKGKNLSHLNQLDLHGAKVHTLPHPRWVMQYRRKDLDHWVQRYTEILGRHPQQYNSR
jgi:hypothetical protein